MTSQRLVEDFARYLWERDEGPMRTLERRVPDSYMNEAAVFLAGELGQRLQHGEVRPLPEWSILSERLHRAEQAVLDTWFRECREEIEAIETEQRKHKDAS